MNPRHHGIEFLHAAGRIIGQVGVYVIIIGDGVGRPCLTFDKLRGGRRKAADARAGSMPQHAGYPQMRDAQTAQIPERRFIHVGKMPAGSIAVAIGSRVGRAPEAGEQLVNQLFHKPTTAWPR